MKNRSQIIVPILASLCFVVLLLVILKSALYFVTKEPLIEFTPKPLKLMPSEELSTFTSITQQEYNLSISGKFSVVETSARKTILTNNTMTCCFLVSDHEIVSGMIDSAQQSDGFSALQTIYHTSSSDIWNIWTQSNLESHFVRMAMKATILPATGNGQYFFEFKQRDFKGFLAGSPDKGNYYAEVFPDSSPFHVITIYLRMSDVYPETNHEDILNLLSTLNIEKISNQQVDPIVTTPVDEVEAQSTQQP